MANKNSRSVRRQRRQFRIRRHVSGMPDKPRLSVFRSARHIYVQAIDDRSGITLATASTREKEFKEAGKSYSGNRASAAEVGKKIAERLVKQGVQQAVFDRGGNRYHGRVQALADGAREGGLKF